MPSTTLQKPLQKHKLANKVELEHNRWVNFKLKACVNVIKHLHAKIGIGP